jgi:hypothetical protein
MYIVHIDAPPSSLMGSNVSSNWKQWKSKESRHADALPSHEGGTHLRVSQSQIAESWTW